MTVYFQADQISCSKEKHVNHKTLYDKRKLSPKWYTNSEDIFLYEHICTVSTGLILKHWDVYAPSWNGKLYSFIFWRYHSFNLITVFSEQNTICIFCQLNLWIISLKFAFVMHEKSWRKKGFQPGNCNHQYVWSLMQEMTDEAHVRVGSVISPGEISWGTP